MDNRPSRRPTQISLCKMTRSKDQVQVLPDSREEKEWTA